MAAASSHGSSTTSGHVAMPKSTRSSMAHQRDVDATTHEQRTERVGRREAGTARVERDRWSRHIGDDRVEDRRVHSVEAETAVEPETSREHGRREHAERVDHDVVAERRLDRLRTLHRGVDRGESLDRIGDVGVQRRPGGGDEVPGAGIAVAVNSDRDLRDERSAPAARRASRGTRAAPRSSAPSATSFIVTPNFCFTRRISSRRTDENANARSGVSGRLSKVRGARNGNAASRPLGETSTCTSRPTAGTSETPSRSARSGIPARNAPESREHAPARTGRSRTRPASPSGRSTGASGSRSKSASNSRSPRTPSISA